MLPPRRGHFVLFVFATDTWTGELTNAEPDKHLTAGWAAASRRYRPNPERVDFWSPAQA
ncbi:hypothetical protein ACFUJR_14330 [Streptomyces sp. NPDC057271]|uniref:hypothetical protein n=1 Tax=unclassified Streptomyces TaxID=2593676 RepID=UPI003645D55C